jgi:hypothetical protein
MKTLRILTMGFVFVLAAVGQQPDLNQGQAIQLNPATDRQVTATGRQLTTRAGWSNGDK